MFVSSFSEKFLFPYRRISKVTFEIKVGNEKYLDVFRVKAFLFLLEYYLALKRRWEIQFRLLVLLQ